MPSDLQPSTAAMVASATEAADFLKRFAHPARLMVLCALVEGERSVRQLEDSLGLRQPALSQQLAELRAAGLIEGRKEARRVFYRLSDERVASFVALLHRLFCERPSA